MTQDEEFSFKIDAYTPETMPMARLAEYIAQLATILGEEKAVHFVRLEKGSTEIIHKVEREAVPKVRERTADVRRGRGTSDARRAYRKVNRLLREDNGKAVLKEESTGAEIIAFPGIEEKQETFSGVGQRAAVDGEVVRIGGIQKWVPILLRAENEPVPNCWCKHDIAKSLARHLFEPVRLFGRGRWERDGEGKWSLDHFAVDSFVPLKDESLSQAIARIAAIPDDSDALNQADLPDREEEEVSDGGF